MSVDPPPLSVAREPRKPAVVPRWTFHPLTLRREMSVPTCEPAKVAWTEPAQLVTALVLPAPAGIGTRAGGLTIMPMPGPVVTVPVPVLLNLVVSSPPTPRAQTPPPG